MSKHELLAAHLRGFEDHRCNLAADALEAKAREIEGLRKQDERDEDEEELPEREGPEPIHTTH